MSFQSRLKITVIAYEGKEANNNAACCEFGTGEQITIGRSAGNHLVLDDPSRVISRVQMRLVFRDATSAELLNLSGTTSLFINTQELLPGTASVLHLGDSLMVGAYVLRLENASSALSQPLVSPLLPSQVLSSRVVPEAVHFSGAIDLTLANSLSSANSPAPSHSPAGMDFFSSANHPSPVAQPFQGFSDSTFMESGQALIPDGDASTDSMLAHLLDHAPRSAGKLLGDPSDATEFFASSGSGDLASLLKVDAAPAFSPTGIDSKLEIESPFVAPRFFSSPETNSSAAVSAESDSPAMSNTPVLTSQEASVAIQNPTAAVMQNTTTATPYSDTETAFNNHECREALARVLHMDVNKLPAFTPMFFEHLGGILLHLTAGTVNMMHGRAQVKHEMRADVTIIAASGNNPLKFAPDAQAAIAHLLGEPMPGFMRAKEAIDDAFDDLLAHQIGLLSGARAAVYDVVKNFSPEKVQKYLAAKNIIDALLPMSKKAKLWALYETHYAEVAGNAREEFELRFQQAFAQAYEQEIDRMCEARESA